MNGLMNVLGVIVGFGLVVFGVVVLRRWIFSRSHKKKEKKDKRQDNKIKITQVNGLKKMRLPRFGEDVPVAVVAVVEGGVGQTPLFRGGVADFGRGSAETYKQSISRHHCQILFDEGAGGFVVKDMMSMNGTFVGRSRQYELLCEGRLLSGDSYVLRDGDYIGLGKPGSGLIFQFRYADDDVVHEAHAYEAEDDRWDTNPYELVKYEKEVIKRL